MLLKNSQSSQENTCTRVSFLIKLQAIGVSFLIKLQATPATLLKKKLWYRCFPANFGKFLRAPFLQNASGRLILYNILSCLEVDFVPNENFIESHISFIFLKDVSAMLALFSAVCEADIERHIQAEFQIVNKSLH